MSRAALLSGIGLLAVIWAGPLLDAWRSSFAAHMLAHMGVVALAAPLIAVGLSSGTPLLRPRFARPPAPPRREGEASSDERRWKERVVDASTLLPALPLIASLLELVVVWAWHAPALRTLAENSTVAAVIEQASFLAAGLFLWLACIGAGASGSMRQNMAGAFGLLLTSIHMTLLGALLALSPRPLYGLNTVTCFGLKLDPQQDQVLGGVIMLSIGAAVYLAGGVLLFRRAIRADMREAAR